MKRFIRKFLSAILPRKILGFLQMLERQMFGVESEFKGLSNKQIFAKIYEDNLWGGDSDKNVYYSGSGSHSSLAVDAYIGAIKSFLDGFSINKILVDLGCGDFNVGSKIVPMSSKYIACDIVDEVIRHNRLKFKDNKIDFRVLDLTKDELPCGDVVFVRQVLQHLSNDDIYKFCSKMKGMYSYLILSEHIPSSKKFVPNLDKPSGSRTRLFLNSGIIITEPPFSLRVIRESVICEVSDQGGVIRTIAYQL